jgi:hypothetical protein
VPGFDFRSGHFSRTGLPARGSFAEQGGARRSRHRPISGKNLAPCAFSIFDRRYGACVSSTMAREKYIRWYTRMYRFLVHPYVPGFRYTRMHRVPVHPYAPEKKFYCSVGPAFHVCLTLPFGLLSCLGSAALIAPSRRRYPPRSASIHWLAAGSWRVRKQTSASGGIALGRLCPAHAVFCRAARLR